MIYKWAWGLALIFIGLSKVGANMPYLVLAAGVALVVAGIAYIAGK